jgi:hypothetical protein
MKAYWGNAFLTSALDGGVKIHASAVLFPGEEELVSTGLEAGWTPEPVWTRR